MGYEMHRDQARARMVGVISASPGEGRTTLAVNLARTMALSGARVLLVDLDSRRPMISRAASADVPGTSAESVIHPSARLGCDILPLPTAAAGVVDINALSGLRARLGALQDVYDAVVIDMPPCSCSMETLAISSAIRDFIVVVAAGRSRRDTVLNNVARNPVVAPRILGVVLT
jgi:Mrp family chromosome partitioning ATPase